MKIGEFEVVTMMRKIIILCVLVAIAGLILFFYLTSEKKEWFELTPQKATARVIENTGIAGTEVGTGWSTNENPTEAVREAVTMALQGKTQKKPHFAVIFASAGSDIAAILSAARQLLGEDTKIFGGTSDSRAVMTDKGFIKVTQRGYQLAERQGRKGLVVMTVSSKDIVFGVGSANLSAFNSPQEMSQAALLSAIRSAGKSENEPPKTVLISPTIGIEEEVLEGIERILGRNIAVLGGTVGGPDGAVFGQDEIYSEGISLAVIYTELPVGWTFEGGFDVTDRHSGIATKVEGQAIMEIDHQPALEVYNEWLGGEIERLYQQVGRADKVRDLLTLHPLYRKYTSPEGEKYFLFSHPWPKDDRMEDKAIMTSTKIKVGEKLYLSHGTWETLINRIGNLPKNASIHGEIDINSRPILGISFICGGVMGVIPESEREKMSFLINYTNNNAPFIANFTWGEQGYFPGIGNKHGNLLASFIVIGPKGAK